MKNKQIIGLIVAGVVFVFVCSTSVLVNSFSTKKATALTQMQSIMDDYQLPVAPFVCEIKIDGVISSATSSSAFSSVGYDHKATLNLIDKLIKSKENKGILLYVNSPGGGVYESDELYLKLQEYKEKTKRPIWTYMATEACSGGYYISMASDKIYANRNTWTGSIGVIVSLSNYKGLYDKLGIKTILFTSGPNKAMGNSGIDMTDQQAQILQSLVDESYGQFVDVVSKGRKLSPEVVKPIADGRIYSAKQALDKKLIDGIQGYEQTVAAFKDQIGGNVEIYTPESTKFNFASIFSGASSSKATLSDAEALNEILKTQGSGVPMYYADTIQ